MGTKRWKLPALRSMLHDVLPLLQVLSAIFMGWKGLSCLFDTPHPIMVVTTGSMEPAFQPGDVLLMVNHQQDVRIGDLPVCWFPERPFPMIHRIVQVLHQENQDPDLRQLILTKGDNNPIDDTLMYPEDQEYIYRRQIMGFVRGYVPLAGWPVLLMQDPSRLRELTARMSRGLGSG